MYGTDCFKEYISNTISLMDMIKKGKCDTDESDVLRELLMDTNSLLIGQEYPLVDNLPGDIYQTHGSPMYFQCTNPEEIKEKLKISMKKVDFFNKNQDIDSVVESLSLLRYSLGYSDLKIAFMRSRCWHWVNHNVEKVFLTYMCKKK